MLVLTRRLGEGIIIGNNIRVVVVDIKGNQIKIGIKAPEHITIYREELHNKIVEQNIKASKTSNKKLTDIIQFWKKDKKS